MNKIPEKDEKLDKVTISLLLKLGRNHEVRVLGTSVYNVSEIGKKATPGTNMTLQLFSAGDVI